MSSPNSEPDSFFCSVLCVKNAGKGSRWRGEPYAFPIDLPCGCFRMVINGHVSTQSRSLACDPGCHTEGKQ